MKVCGRVGERVGRSKENFGREPMIVLVLTERPVVWMLVSRGSRMVQLTLHAQMKKVLPVRTTETYAIGR
jgi:hypothetical protein